MDETGKASTKAVLGRTDLGFIRLLEELIGLLHRKGVIDLKDLPHEAAARQALERTQGEESKRIATKVVMDRADLAFIRVLEDLVEVLQRKGIIDLDEFPPKAKDKVLERRMLRRD
ncbi:MAG: hypothetical protein WD014_05625 [Dongiaceae bacterium]